MDKRLREKVFLYLDDLLVVSPTFDKVLDAFGKRV